jgi:hypothetical protein
MRAFCLLLLAATASQALLLPPAAPLNSLSRAEAGVSQSGICMMARRQNLKKEKRQRNRINAFRFKKRVPFRFNRFNDRNQRPEANPEDVNFAAMVFTHMAVEAEQLAAAEASKDKKA